MRKKILSLLLVVCMVLGLVPATALAAPEYTDEGTPTRSLEITWNEGAWQRGGEEPLPAGVSFDEASSTLTLSGAELNSISAWDWGSERLTIQVTGENTVSADSGANGIDLVACHDVVITGTGTLTVENTGVNEGGWYGTPLYVWDLTIPKPDSDERHLYAKGQVVLDGGVTVKLKNPETDMGKNTRSMNVAENLTVKNGRLEEESLTGAYVMGDLTVESGASLQAVSLTVSGFDDGYALDGGNGRSFTVGGTVTLTGASREDMTWDGDAWVVTLTLDPGATLVLQDGGALTVNGPKAFDGQGIVLGGLDAERPYLEPACAKIQGGTLTVNMNLMANRRINGSAMFIGGGSEVSFSGNAKANILYTGAHEGKLTAVDLSGIWSESGEEDVGAVLTVSDNAEVMIDLSGLTENTGDDGITGIETTWASKINVTGGKLSVKGMGGPALWFTGIGLFGTELAISGGEVNVIAPDSGSADDVVGVRLGGFGDREQSMIMTGGALNIDLKAAVTDNQTGLDVSQDSSVDLSGGDVTCVIGGEQQGNFSGAAGVRISGRDASVKMGKLGNLTVTTDGLDQSSFTGITVTDFADLTIGNGSTVNVDAREASYGQGITALSYAGITITGGTVNLDASGNGILLGDNTVCTVTGGTVSVNKKEPRPAEEGYTVGINLSGYLRVLGGQMDIQARVPVGTMSRVQNAPLMTFGTGITAVYAQGTMLNGVDYGGRAVMERTYYIDYTGSWLSDYILEDENGPYNGEFGVVIKAQSAKGEYSGLLELVNAGRLIAGQSYTARMIATLPDGTGTLTVTGTNGKIEKGSVTVNGEVPEDVEYNAQGDSFTVTIKSGDVVRFQVIPGAGENTYTASVAGETETLTFEAEAYSMEVPTSTNKAEVTVSGTAAPNTTVEIYVDGKKAEEVTANGAGSWSATVTLPDEGEHKLQAKVGSGFSEEKTVTYHSDAPVAQSLTVSNMIHGNTVVDPDVETSFTIDFVDPSKSVGTRYYTYWPELPTFTFTVTFDKPEQVADARVVVTDWLGRTQAVYLSYNIEDGTWTGTTISATVKTSPPISSGWSGAMWTRPARDRRPPMMCRGRIPTGSRSVTRHSSRPRMS